MLKTACTIFGALSLTSTTMAVNLDSLADTNTEVHQKKDCMCQVKVNGNVTNRTKEALIGTPLTDE